MIAITGASGQLGRLVVQELLKTVSAENIIAAVRSPEKVADFAELGVQVRQADYDQPETLATALAGAEKVLLISSSEFGRRVAHHTNVINAAKDADVQLLAYTSVLRADTSPLGLAVEHKETERVLANSGVPFALLRNGWYTENYTASIPMTLQMGGMIGCAGDAKFSAATRADYAAGAAAVLTTANQAGKVYELVGDEAFSLSELAAEISLQTGKEIAYTNMSEPAFAGALLGAGLPEPLANMLASSETAASNGALFDDNKALRTLIGRPTTTLKSVVRAAIA